MIGTSTFWIFQPPFTRLINLLFPILLIFTALPRSDTIGVFLSPDAPLLPLLLLVSCISRAVSLANYFTVRNVVLTTVGQALFVILIVIVAPLLKFLFVIGKVSGALARLTATIIAICGHGLLVILTQGLCFTADTAELEVWYSGHVSLHNRLTAPRLLAAARGILLPHYYSTNRRLLHIKGVNAYG